MKFRGTTNIVQYCIRYQNRKTGKYDGSNACRISYHQYTECSYPVASYCFAQNKKLTFRGESQQCGECNLCGVLFRVLLSLVHRETPVRLLVEIHRGRERRVVRRLCFVHRSGKPGFLCVFVEKHFERYVVFYARIFVVWTSSASVVVVVRSSVVVVRRDGRCFLVWWC